MLKTISHFVVFDMCLNVERTPPQIMLSFLSEIDIVCDVVEAGVCDFRVLGRVLANIIGWPAKKSIHGLPTTRKS